MWESFWANCVNQPYVDEFRKECEIFAIAGEQLSKVLPIKTLQEWKERKNNFDNWMKEVKQVIRDQQQMEQINLPWKLLVLKVWNKFLIICTMYVHVTI